MLARLIGRLMAAYVRLVAVTCRPSSRGFTGEQVVLAFWHEYNLAAAVACYRLRRRHRHVSFSTRGFRGRVMNQLLASLDAGAVTLPDEGQRHEALWLAHTMAALGRAGATLAVSPDGPAGPYRVAKPGALIVARESGLLLQPWALDARPALRLGRRWDRHLVPLPFCRIRVVEGAPLLVAPRARLRPLLAELQAQLDRIAQVADRR